MGAPSRGAPWRAGGRKSLNGSGRSDRCRGVRAPFRCALAAVRAQEHVSARKKTGRTAAGRGARWLRSGARCWGPSVPRAAVLRAPCAPRVLRVHPAVPRALLDGAAGDPEETHVRVPPAPCCPRCAALSCRAVAAVPGCISSLQSSPASLCNGLCSALCPAAALAFFRGRAHAHTHAPLKHVARAPPPALCGRVPQAIAGLCAVQERRAGWSPRAAAAGRRGTGLGRAAGRGARRGARLEAVSAGPPGAAARRCPAGQPRGWRPAAGVPLVLARRALAPGPVG